MIKKILVVEDEPDLLTITAFRLKKAGYEVITAINGPQALDMVRKDKPDLVILDLRIPIISGIEVAKTIKNDPELKHIPIILFTASVMGDMNEKLKETMAEDYIIKPFEPDDLLKKVKKFF